MNVRDSAFRALAAAAVAALLAGGCGDEATGPERVAPTAADMALVASDLALVAATGLQQYTVAGLAASSSGPSPATAAVPAVVDTLLQGLVSCPLVLHHREATSFYELRYGAGCTSSFDGLATSGSVLFTVDDQVPFSDYDLFPQYEDFTRGGRRVNGLMEIKGAPSAYLTLEAQGLDMSGVGATAFVSADLELNPAADPCDGESPLCAAWNVTSINTGAVSTDLHLYNVILQDTLVVSGCHPHFVSGAIAVVSAGTFPAIIDFGDGTCDDTATMTVEGRTETITLGYGS